MLPPPLLSFLDLARTRESRRELFTRARMTFSSAPRRVSQMAYLHKVLRIDRCAELVRVNTLKKTKKGLTLNWPFPGSAASSSGSIMEKARWIHLMESFVLSPARSLGIVVLRNPFPIANSFPASVLLLGAHDQHPKSEMHDVALSHRMESEGTSTDHFLHRSPSLPARGHQTIGDVPVNFSSINSATPVLPSCHAWEQCQSEARTQGEKTPRTASIRLV